MASNRFDWFWHGVLRRPYRLDSTVHGEADKPVVVLLHGIAASGEDWGKLIPLLTPRYRCITIDLLGFGKSPKPDSAPYDMDQHIGAIHSTIRSLHLGGPFILVGHSLGSLLATRYARAYPREVKRLLLLSPPVYPPLVSITGKVALRRTDILMRIYRFLRTHPRMTPENIRRISRISVLPPSIAKHPDTWVPFKRSLERCIEQQTIEQDITAVRAPIDIFYGTLDTVVVGSNVQSLASKAGVEVHAFRGNHTLSKHYGSIVSKLLLSVD